MSRYNTLLQERADLVGAGREMFAAAEDAGRDLTDEERTQDNEAQTRLEAVNDELGRLERQREREAGLPTEAVIADVEKAVAQAEAIVAIPKPFSAEGRPWQRGFGEQLAAIARAYSNPSASPDNRLMEIMAATGMSEGVGSEGGFLVQTDFTAELLREVYETGVLASRTDRTDQPPAAVATHSAAASNRGWRVRAGPGSSGSGQPSLDRDCRNRRTAPGPCDAGTRQRLIVILPSA